MLINPYTEAIVTIPGTRLLVGDLNLTGVSIVDPINGNRIWTVTAVYAPVHERHLGGIRIKLMDQKGFTTFCNQRDFEIMLGLARPGDWCRWTDNQYPGPGDEGWFGFCMDETDREDDLYEHELALRAENPGAMLPQNSEIWRRLHPGGIRVAEEFWILSGAGDVAQETGYGPDTRLETLVCRWCLVSRDWFDNWSRI